MAAIQCKMCGGMVDVVDGVTSKECPYCGTLTTFPKISDDRRENLYNRAEHFRRAGDFDKAVAAYESILNEDSSDPEAYWGIAISRFGIEYVEDPATHERIPTCHRVQYESFTSDPDYLSALEHSAGTAEHEIYEREGARIAEIQKNILKISAQEKPFDIFICYKESTDGGTRTKDSTVAQDIYYQLTNAGYKVFFARITLESKLGQQYEPYIFAALNSAKVMLVIGSKTEYFNAVWVKNEWSRFLALKKKDNSRLIIPCYRDMDPYDLPEELSLFQSQDMSKIGFIQDILHGIKKVLRKEDEQPKSAESSGVTAKSNVLENLIRRIVMFIHDGDSKSAAEYCEKVLDQNMECGIVYYYKTLLECEVFSAADLILKDVDFTGSKNFRHALSFSAGEEKEKLDFLARAWKFMGSFKSKSVYDLKTFSANCDKYLDANDAKILNKIIDKRIAEVNALEQIYNSGLAELEAKNYKSAIEIFKSLPEVYKDSEKQQQFAVDSAAYERALALETEKNYKEASDEFEKILSFSDAKDHFCECQYLRGEQLIREKKYVEAKSCFDNLKEYTYKDCNVRSIECQQLYDTQLLLQKVKKIATVAGITIAATFLIILLIFWGYQSATSPEFSDDEKTLESYKHVPEEYAVPDHVTTIGKKAFKGCVHLKKITIPDSVTTIEDHAFEGCTGLTSVTIPDSVTKIGRGAFEGCKNLSQLIIKNPLVSIEEYAFKGTPYAEKHGTYVEPVETVEPEEKNPTLPKKDPVLNEPQSVATSEDVVDKNLKQAYGKIMENIAEEARKKAIEAVNKKTADMVRDKAKNKQSDTDREALIPYGTVEINAEKFKGRTDLTYIVIPDSVTKIGDAAFYKCTNLTSITIPDSVTKIGWGAFYHCTNLTSVTIPDSVTEIEGCAFSDCTNLTSITIPNSVTAIGGSAFYKCTNLTSITIPNSVTEIGSSAFSGCTNLTNITIPDSVTKIGDRAFSGCTNLTSVTIPDSVTKIVNYAFYGCTNLTSITIPDSVTKIGYGAFSDTAALVKLSSDHPVFMVDDSGALIDKKQKNILYLPKTYMGAYSLPENITRIESSAFFNCTGLTSITIPDSVTKIGYSAFAGCTGLTSVTIPDSVTKIEMEAFYGCTNLTSITIPDSVTAIGGYAFYKCTNLTSITIPDSVTKIGDSAFFGCKSLTSVSIPANCKYNTEDSFKRSFPNTCRVIRR